MHLLVIPIPHLARSIRLDLQSLGNPNMGSVWQAFCEMGRAHSRYPEGSLEKLFAEDDRYVKLFSDCMGCTYRMGANDFCETHHIFRHLKKR